MANRRPLSEEVDWRLKDSDSLLSRSKVTTLSTRPTPRVLTRICSQGSRDWPDQGSSLWINYVLAHFSDWVEAHVDLKHEGQEDNFINPLSIDLQFMVESSV